jgi:hypothetical protein
MQSNGRTTQAVTPEPTTFLCATPHPTNGALGPTPDRGEKDDTQTHSESGRSKSEPRLVAKQPADSKRDTCDRKHDRSGGEHVSSLLEPFIRLTKTDMPSETTR